MKVLLINGSPHEKRNTYKALCAVADALNHEGIDTEIFQIGTKPISGCLGCRSCAKLKRCIVEDRVNEFLEHAGEFDGFIFGTPVYFASANGALTAFMDRVFFTDLLAKGERFYLKPAAAVSTARRAGATATFDQMNKYFTLMQMPIISSQYWNMIYEGNARQLDKDEEGFEIMETLGKNMAWFLKCKEAGIKAGVAFPKR